MNFVYPFVPNDILEDQPVDVCKSRKWKWYTAYNVYKLKSQFPNNIIPVGTKLYHGSMDANGNGNGNGNIKFDQQKLTFFGIDVVISLWILPEQRRAQMYKELGYDISLSQQDDYNKNHDKGYLYEFQVVKPIPVHLIEDLCQYPLEVKTCKEKPCLHPQIGPDSPIYNLSTELTMGMKNYKDIQLKKKYEVDVNKLEENQDKLFSKFDPVSAINSFSFRPKNKKSTRKSTRKPKKSTRKSTRKPKKSTRKPKKSTRKSSRKPKKSTRKSSRKPKKSTRKSSRKPKKSTRKPKKSTRKPKKSARKSSRKLK